MQLNGTLTNSKIKGGKLVYQLLSNSQLTCNTKSYLAWLLLHVLTRSLSGVDLLSLV